ncbi:MAG: SDR family NAD(P)-dependent oxidoreductase [Verrucomicrobia bacterium]|nr:SDR family NAD(P)-dependent oxidoreductase [Verrucomicrobiota bacterium]
MKKKMLLTGATSPIGTYLAQHFAQLGFALFLHGRDQKKLDALARKLGSADVVLLRCDLAETRSISKMFEELSAKTKTLDVLINNAFGKLESELVGTNGEALAEFFQVSLAGTADVIRQTIPFLKRNKAGNIVNIVADWGFPMHNVMTGPSAYISAKYAVHGLGAALQTEVAKFGIKTTNLCPGIVAADIDYGTTDEAFLKAKGKSAINPKDLAKAIEFILGQEFSHVRSLVLTPSNPEYNGL